MIGHEDSTGNECVGTGVSEWRDGGPIPRRFLWLRRLTVASGCLLIGLVGLRGWWGFEAHRRLQAEIERCHSAGQPVYASEFDEALDAVGKDENAAVLLEEAINGIVAVSTSGVSFRLFVDEPEALVENLNAAAELLRGNAGVLDLVGQARSRPAVAWSQRLENLTASFNPALGQGQRNLARLLWFAAYYQYETGDHAAAVEAIKDLVFLSEAVDAHPTLISSMIAWANHYLAFALIERVGGKLEIRDGPSVSGDVERTATRGQVEELVNMLLDESASREAVIRSYYGDRAYVIDALDSQIAGLGMWDRVTSFVTQPIRVLDTVRAVKLSTLAAAAAAEDNWPDAASLFPREAESYSLLRSLTRPVTDTPFGSAWEVVPLGVQGYFTYLARRRMAATALAIRIFELDCGRRPKTITELVPQYMPRAPVDPFSTEGASLRYRLDAERAVLYSVAGHGKDDNGVRRLRPDHRMDFEKSYIVLYLDGRPARNGRNSTPSQEAVRDHEDVEHNRRQADQSQAHEPDPE